ncbi:MAG: hypothetical protein H0U76_01135 [Ktedonobacteraceae bacterium]|nr:hypothetical protein [Ktedonobacteraceae bacterium]
MSDLRRRVLLVEGRDDQHILKNLFVQHKIPCYIPVGDESDEYDQEKVLILAREGVDAVLEDFAVRVKESDLVGLGVIVDADTDLGSRWTAWRDVLIRNGYSDAHVPAVPDPNGTVVEQRDKATVGIWIMPDNTVAGMLEDFAAFLIPDSDILWRRAKACVDQIPLAERGFAAVHLSKAYIHTWLAWQAIPGTPLGQAITRKYFDTKASSAQDLMNWAHRLFTVAP